MNIHALCHVEYHFPVPSPCPLLCQSSSRTAMGAGMLLCLTCSPNYLWLVLCFYVAFFLGVLFFLFNMSGIYGLACLYAKIYLFARC